VLKLFVGTHAVYVAGPSGVRAYSCSSRRRAARPPRLGCGPATSFCNATAARCRTLPSPTPSRRSGPRVASRSWCAAAPRLTYSRRNRRRRGPPRRRHRRRRRRPRRRQGNLPGTTRRRARRPGMTPSQTRQPSSPKVCCLSI